MVVVEKGEGVANLQGSRYARDIEQSGHGSRVDDHNEPSLPFCESGMGRHDRAETRRVHERNSGQIDHCYRLGRVDRIGNGFIQLLDSRNVDLADQGDDVGLVMVLVIDAQTQESLRNGAESYHHVSMDRRCELTFPADARWLHAARTVLDAAITKSQVPDQEEFELAMGQILEDVISARDVESVVLHFECDSASITLVASGETSDLSEAYNDVTASIGWRVAASTLQDPSIQHSSGKLRLSGRMRPS